MANSEKSASTVTSGPLQKSWLVATVLMSLTAVFLFRSLLTAWFNLIPDECSYWGWSRRLDWSYFDNSGMVAYLIRLSTELFGTHTPFTVRFPFLMLSFFTTYLVYRTSFILFGNAARALLSALIFNLTPAYLIGGSAAMHDNALIFFWMFSLWAAARFVRSGDKDWFYVMGAGAGLSIQSKYTGVLIIPCLFFFLLFSKPHRRHLMSRWPWIGALVAAALTLPIVLWNIEHGWVSLHHVLYIGSGSTTLERRILDGLGYHASQLALVSPLLFFALIVASGAALCGCFRKAQPEHILLLCFGLPLILFGVLAFKGHVEANWGFIGYPSLVILSVEIITRRRQESSSRLWGLFGRRFRKWAVLLSVCPVAIVALHAWIGILPASLEARLGKTDRIVWETRGWDGLGVHVGDLKAPTDVIAADSYQLCALLEFNVPENPKVRYLAPWNRPTQFDVWNPTFEDLKGRHVLFVSSRPLEPSSEIRTTVFENFSRVESLPVYKVQYHGVAIREIYLYVGYDFDPSNPRRLGPRSLHYADY